MFQKSHHEAGVSAMSSLMRTSNEDQSGMEQTFSRARKLAAARANRGYSGGMFCRTSHRSRGI